MISRSFWLYFYLTAVIGLLTVQSLHAQSNIREYTPSVLLQKDRWEFKSFYNLYTQNKRFSENSLDKVPSGLNRENYATWINSFLYGTGGRFNAGFDIWMKSVNVGDAQSQRRTAVVGVGPKLKIAPFKKLESLSIQTSFLFPAARDTEGRSRLSDKPDLFLEFDRSLWLTQFFYDLHVGPKSQFFFQQAFWYNIVRDSYRENNFLQTQTSVFYNYFLDARWTLYGMTEFFPTHYDDRMQEFKAFNSFFVQSGVGAKYQIIPAILEAEILYTNFWLGSPGSGAGETFNIGLRLIQ